MLLFGHVHVCTTFINLDLSITLCEMSLAGEAT